MTLRTKYSSKEIEVLESYSHRLNNKVHISFPCGEFGDMLWASIFVTNALSHMKDISEVCPVTPTGRVDYDTSVVKDATHFAFKLGNAVNVNLETRHDILFAVYMTKYKFDIGNEMSLTEPINRFDDKVDGSNVIDTVISHCCAGSPAGCSPEAMLLFESEFHQKLIFIASKESDMEFYAQICNRKHGNMRGTTLVNPNRSVVDNNNYIKKYTNYNTLVVNPNSFVIDDNVYRKCVKEILDFIGMKVDADGINKMISYRTFWFDKQPKYILDYNFEI